MALKYYSALGKVRTATPKQSYQDDYNAILDLTFDNAHNVVYDEIEYEQTYGEEDFAFIHRVRVDTVFEYNTGIIPSDDFRTLIFPPEFEVEPYYGMKFRWKNNYWLVVNTSEFGTLANTAEIRRCNSSLKFFNSKGEKVQEPCIMDYTLRFTKNEDTKVIPVGKAEQKCWVQRNKRSEMVYPNMRFLFGTTKQRVSFRIYGGGMKNYLNTETYNDNSPTLSEFYMQHYEISDVLDDLENGYADAFLNEAVIIPSKTLIDLGVGEEALISVEALKGELPITNAYVYWDSNNTQIVSVENEEDAGLYKKIVANGLGNATITLRLDGTNITSTIEIRVGQEIAPTTELVVYPNRDYVLQDRSQTFNIHLFKNGIMQNDEIVFTNMTVDIPHDKYDIVVNNSNSFTIVNKGMYMRAPLIVRCTCGDIVKDLNIQLRGLF